MSSLCPLLEAPTPAVTWQTSDKRCNRSDLTSRWHNLSIFFPDVVLNITFAVNIKVKNIFPQIKIFLMLCSNRKRIHQHHPSTSLSGINKHINYRLLINESALVSPTQAQAEITISKRLCTKKLQCLLHVEKKPVQKELFFPFPFNKNTEMKIHKALVSLSVLSMLKKFSAFYFAFRLQWGGKRWHEVKKVKTDAFSLAKKHCTGNLFLGMNGEVNPWSLTDSHIWWLPHLCVIVRDSISCFAVLRGSPLKNGT